MKLPVPLNNIKAQPLSPESTDSPAAYSPQESLAVDYSSQQVASPAGSEDFSSQQASPADSVASTEELLADLAEICTSDLLPTLPPTQGSSVQPAASALLELCGLDQDESPLDLRLQPAVTKTLPGKSTAHHKAHSVPIKPATTYIPSVKPIITGQKSETADTVSQQAMPAVLPTSQPNTLQRPTFLPPSTSATSQPSQAHQPPVIPQSILKGPSKVVPIKPKGTPHQPQPAIQTSIQSINSSVTQLLATLGSRSVPLQQALAAECTPSALPLSLVQAATPTTPGGLPLVPQQIPLTARVSMFQVSLLNLGLQSKAVELSQFYQLQSSKLESDRIIQLQNYSATPQNFPVINKYFDMQHHALLDNLNLQLTYLRAKSTAATPARPVSNQARMTPTPSNKAATPSNKENQAPASQFKAHIPNSESKSKPKSTPLSNLAVRIMMTWYQKNMEHPYPSADAIKVMAQAGNITNEQVRKWFANKRLRSKNTKDLSEIARRRKQPFAKVKCEEEPQTKKIRI